MKTHRPRGKEDSNEDDLDYQHFKIRLQVSANRIKKAFITSAVSELLEKIGQWCQLSITSEQMENVGYLYENKKQRFDSRSSRPAAESRSYMSESFEFQEAKQSLKIFLRILGAWFKEEKPEMYRVKPISEMTDSRYFLILFTYIQDYKLLNEIMTEYGHYDGEIEGLLEEYSQKHMNNYPRVKHLGSGKVKNLEAVKKEITTAIAHINEMQKLDTQMLYKDRLEEALVFYSAQLRLLRERFSTWDRDINEKSSEFLISLFQKKLIKRLLREKGGSRLQFYRENLLKLYLELTDYNSQNQETTDLSEVENLEKVREFRDSQEDLKYFRISLINHWKSINEELTAIVQSFLSARADKHTQDKWQMLTEQFDGIFGHVISRLNLAIPKVNGSEFIKLHDQVRKYINFKEKRLLVPNGQIKEYFANVLQNIIWDYQGLSKIFSIKQLICKYESLLDVIQGKSTDIQKFESDILVVVLSCSLYIDKTREDTSFLEKLREIKDSISESNTENEYLTLILLRFMDLTKDNYLKCLEVLARRYPGTFTILLEKQQEHQTQVEDKPELENLTVTFVRNEDQANKPTTQNISNLCDYKEPLDNVNYGFTQIAQAHNVFGISPSAKEKVYDSESIQGINDIFRFYSSQKSDKSEVKPGMYLNLEQFYMFARDFSLQLHPDLLKQAFFGNSRSKLNINEIQFYSLLEDLSEKLFDEGSVKENTRAFLETIGCFDYSYKNYFTGSVTLESPESPAFKPASKMLKKPCLDSPMSPIKNLKLIKGPITPKALNPKASKILQRYKTSLNMGLKKM